MIRLMIAALVLLGIFYVYAGNKNSAQEGALQPQLQELEKAKAVEDQLKKAAEAQQSSIQQQTD